MHGFLRSARAVSVGLLALLVFVLIGCSGTTSIALGSCGNGALEGGEDCDGAKGCTSSCHFDCHSCPIGWACDVTAGFCRSPSGWFRREPLEAEGSGQLLAAGFDGDLTVDGLLDVVAPDSKLLFRDHPSGLRSRLTLHANGLPSIQKAGDFDGDGASGELVSEASTAEKPATALSALFASPVTNDGAAPVELAELEGIQQLSAAYLYDPQLPSHARTDIGVPFTRSDEQHLGFLAGGADRRLLLAGLLPGCCLGASAARADDNLKDDPRARQFFEVGAQAYDKGQYLLAIDAFEEAFAIAQRPGLLFSLAQAHQRQFRVTGEEAHLAQAIDNYRLYLARAPSGGRQADAAAALNALLAVSQRLHPSNREAPGKAGVFGRLLLSTSTPGARLTVNDELVESLPTALELPADTYRITATAPGFRSHTQQLAIVAGTTVPLNVELTPLPAHLRISGPDGAESFVDGRSVGTLPLGVLSLASGEHSISLRRPGRKTRSVLARLEGGKTTELALDLETTAQRHAAWWLGGAAGVGATLTAGFGIAWLARDLEAAGLERRRSSGGISEQEGRRLNDAVDARDDLRTITLVAGASAAALLGASLLLYFTDTPAAPVATTSREARYERPPAVAWAPLVGAAWGVTATF